MSRLGSRFSPQSTSRPLHDGVRRTGFERFGARACADQLEEISETLRPRNGRSLRCHYETLGIDVLGQLGENGGNLVQAAGMPLVTDEVDGRRLDRRDANGSARAC